MRDAEACREALLDAERALERERFLRSEAESLLAGAARLAGATTIEEMFAALVEILQPQLGFDGAALLVRSDAAFRPVTAIGGLEALRFEPAERLLRGRPTLLFDTRAVPAFRAQAADLCARVGSAIVVPLSAGRRDGALVFTKVESRGFEAAHRRVAERIVPLAVHALLAIERFELRRAQERSASALAAAELLERATSAVDLGVVVRTGSEVQDASDTARALLDPWGGADAVRAASSGETSTCPRCGRQAPAGRVRLDRGEGASRSVLELTFAGHAHRAGADTDDGDLVIVADVTRWVVAEEQLAGARDEALAADRAKTQFLAMMSHELRTPLTAVSGYCDLLREEAEDRSADWALDDLTRVRLAAEQLLALIDDVLDLAKVESGHLTARMEPVDVALLASQVASTIQPLVDRSASRLSIRVDPSADLVFADRVRLRQILLNLLSNAAKFTSGGDIELRVTATPRRTVFEVADTGIGIPVDKLEQVFRPFTQLEGSYSRRFGGSGLGLAISRRFAELMGASLDVESELGKGSSFRLTFPRPDGPPPESAGPLPDETFGDADETFGDADDTIADVLVAEDDVDVRELLLRLLGQAGFVVHAAAHGAAVLEELERHVPDVLVLDLLMPVVSGFDLLGRLRSDDRWRDLPIVVLTAMELSPDQVRMLREKDATVLRKATDLPAKLVRQIRHSARTSRARHGADG